MKKKEKQRKKNPVKALSRLSKKGARSQRDNYRSFKQAGYVTFI
jgi:hypothetical protein